MDGHLAAPAALFDAAEGAGEVVTAVAVDEDPDVARAHRVAAQLDKAPVLLALREELEELKVLLRLCQDVKAFPNFNSFECAITHVTDIAKQNEGWLKSQRQGLGQNRRVMPDRLAEPNVPSRWMGT